MKNKIKKKTIAVYGYNENDAKHRLAEYLYLIRPKVTNIGKCVKIEKFGRNNLDRFTFEIW